MSESGSSGEESEYVTDIDETSIQEDTEKIYTELEAAKVPSFKGKVIVKRGPGRPPKRKKRKICNNLTKGATGSSGVSHSRDMNKSDESSLFDLIRDLTKEVREQGIHMGKKIDELTDKITALERTNQRLNDELIKKDQMISELRDRVDRLEKKERVNHVLIDSPAIESMAEKVFKAEMVKLLAVNLKIPPATLDRFSYAKIGNQGKKKALVIVGGPEDRAKLFSSAKTNKPDGLYVHESLIPSRGKLFYDIRQYRKNSSADFIIYTYYGDVFFKRNKEAQAKRVHSLDDVKRLLAAGARSASPRAGSSSSTSSAS